LAAVVESVNLVIPVFARALLLLLSRLVFGLLLEEVMLDAVV